MITHDADGKIELLTFRGEHRFGAKISPLSAEIVAPYVLYAMRLAGEFQGVADTVTGDYARRRAAKPPEHHPK